MTPPGFDIHPTAHVHEMATLHEGVTVWHWTHVREYALLGEHVSVGQNCYIDHHVCIGAGTRIQNHVSVYHGVRLGCDVFVGPGVRFTNDKRPRVGRRQPGDGQYVKTRTWNPLKPDSTIVEEGASLGAGSVILPVHIEPYAMIAAGAVVTHDVPGHAVMRGNPARCVAFVCRCGSVITHAPSDVPCQVCGFRFDAHGLPWERVVPLSEPWRP